MVAKKEEDAKFKGVCTLCVLTKDNCSKRNKNQKISILATHHPDRYAMHICFLVRLVCLGFALRF